MLVATGRAEVMLDPEMKPWDSAPLLPILREAGGHFTTWDGRATIWGEDGAATNAALHGEVLAVLRSENKGQGPGVRGQGPGDRDRSQGTGVRGQE